MQSENLKDKLIRIERAIVVYKNQGDEAIEEINIDDIPFETVIKIVTAKPDDPLLYDGYHLNNEQIEKLNTYLYKKINYNPELNYCILECTGIYDW